MHNFKFALTWDETVELLYEYVITRSEEYFGLHNKNITFHIFESKTEHYLAICVCADESRYMFDLISYDKLDTTNSYKRIVSKNGVNVNYNCDNESKLLLEEVRYIKFDLSSLLREVSKMFYDMINTYFNIQKHSSNLQFDSDSDKFSYVGVCERVNRFAYKFKNGKTIDLSDEMRDYCV